MSLKNVKYYDEYVSHKIDLLKEFYIPVLSEAVSFDRAVGYFRSDFIYEISKGMSALIGNGGCIRIITSPDLTEEDINSIEEGYDLRRLIEEKLQKSITPPINISTRERANYLAHLIASNKLDIKIAVTNNIRNNGIFHEKWGIITDSEGNKISMIGSNNDTYSGIVNNHESFELNFSWLANTDNRKINAKQKRFQDMWDNHEGSLIICNLPEKIKEEILKHKKDVIISENEITAREVIERMIKSELSKQELIKKPEIPNIPYVPDNISIRDYQWEAYVNWKKNEYRGILSMATGTGKTITALNAVVQLYNLTKKLFVIIVCPYQHLVEQWVEELESFNITPIIGYSKSSQKEWRVFLKNQVKLFNLNKNEGFVCFVTTNATYSKEDTRKLLSELKRDTLFIADEAHNIGTENGLEGLLESYKYRMALSATFERKYDQESTEKLRNYFSKEVYSIGIKEAIFDKKCLVEYEYVPVLTFLTDSEFDEYKELTARIAKGTKRDEKGTLKYMSNDAKLAANMRSLLIARSQNKIESLAKFIPSLQITKNNLIYCGAAKLSLEDMPEFIETNEVEYRHVDYVRDLLNQNDIVAARFTADEDIVQRKFLKEQFANRTIGTIVAIRCLDEGVNIPSIERAYILASSKDQKQYIQRRGRVLRKFSNGIYDKKKAYIYDFISLPFRRDYSTNLSEADYKYGKILVESEIERVNDFYNSCSNQDEVYKIIQEIESTYNLREEKT